MEGLGLNIGMVKTKKNKSHNNYIKLQQQTEKQQSIFPKQMRIFKDTVWLTTRGRPHDSKRPQRFRLSQETPPRVTEYVGVSWGGILWVEASLWQ